jgi:hypothetical protein
MDNVVHATDAVNTWGMLATDGTQYTTLALLQAAGKVAFPGTAHQGIYPMSLALRSEDGSGAAGGRFYFAVNRGTEFSGLASEALRDNKAQLVGNSDQVFVYPGVTEVTMEPISNVWIRKLTAGDEVIVQAIA